MTRAGWIKGVRPSRYGSGSGTGRYERECGAWRVEETTTTSARSFYVMHQSGGGHWMKSYRFPRRFATAEAAMKAVDAMLKRGD